MLLCFFLHPQQDAIKSDVSADIATAIDNVKDIEEQANARIVQDIMDIINDLAQEQGDQHGVHNASLAALQLAVAKMHEDKADKGQVELDIDANRGKLPTEEKIGSCIPEIRGQLRYNTKKDLVEFCGASNTFRPVAYNPQGQCEVYGGRVVTLNSISSFMYYANFDLSRL